MIVVMLVIVVMMLMLIVIIVIVVVIIVVVVMRGILYFLNPSSGSSCLVEVEHAGGHEVVPTEIVGDEHAAVAVVEHLSDLADSVSPGGLFPEVNFSGRGGIEPFFLVGDFGHLEVDFPDDPVELVHSLEHEVANVLDEVLPRLTVNHARDSVIGNPVY
jgi:hypothetical protein